MGRRTLLLSVPLAAAGWLTAHWLTHMIVGPEHGHMHHYLGFAPMCAACVLMLVLLLALVLARPVLALGYELGERFVIVRAPRAPVWAMPPLLPALPEPSLARPPVLATGHGGRAPPPGAGLAHA
jgi:hypothetical protein